MSVDRRHMNLRESVPLAPFTTLGVGGVARWFTTASTAEDVSAAIAWCQERDLPLVIIGGGSNVVVADSGVAALVMRMAIRGVELSQQADGSTDVVAGAGHDWDGLVEQVVARGLAGVECLSGIPGTVGGTPIQNVGAYGQEVSESIESVAAVDVYSGEVLSLPAAACQFSYRMSRFKSEPGRFIVTAVRFRLRPGAPAVRYPDLRAWMERAAVARPALGDVRRAVLDVRRTKGMVVRADDPDSRSVGSFFMNPIVSESMIDSIARTGGAAPPAYPAGEGRAKIPAAWLIEKAGFARGYAMGAASISTKHPLALVNRGGATARDVLTLAKAIKTRVADRFGVLLRPEPVFVGFDEDPDVTYLLHAAPMGDAPATGSDQDSH